MKNQIVKLMAIGLLLTGIHQVQSVEVAVGDLTFDVSEDMAEVLAIVLADKKQADVLIALSQSIIEGKILEQRKAEWTLAYKTARALQEEMELIELLRAFTTGFTEREKIAFKRALQKGLEDAALLEILDELYGRS